MEAPKVIEGFDCVEMKRQGAERIFDAIKHLTPEEQDVYWASLNEKFATKASKLPDVKLAS
jgi:hypothetical protein